MAKVLALTTPVKRLADARVVYTDTQVVVVDKPPGMESCAFEDKRAKAKKSRGGLHGRAGSGPGKGATTKVSPTLLDVTEKLIAYRGLKIVHRLDKDTSGLLVFAKNRDAEYALAQQFRFGKTHRRYIALVHGHIKDQTIQTILMPDRGDGLRGSTPLGARHPKVRELGKESVTHLRVLDQGSDEGRPWSMIECELETGRTHQIRIHLSERGHPLLGEELYLKRHDGGLYVRDPLPASRQMLHAHELGFYHPTKGGPVSWQSPLPSDFLKLKGKQSV